jgi:hypothetical protein
MCGNPTYRDLASGSGVERTPDAFVLKHAHFTTAEFWYR